MPDLIRHPVFVWIALCFTACPASAGMTNLTATMMSLWLTGKLPLEVNLMLYPAGFGVWLPMHLPLSMRLMQVVKMADYQGFTLTAPFPVVKAFQSDCCEPGPPLF